jgi:hypothetical protein
LTLGGNIVRLAFAVLLMFLLATLAWSGIFRDDFEDDDLGNWVKYEWPGQNTGKIEEMSGMLIVTDVDSKFDTTAAFNNRQHIADFTLTVDAKMATAFEGTKSYLEIFFRTVEYKNGDWRLAWNSYYANGEAVLKIWTLIGNNVKEDIVKLPFTLNVDKWYNIKLDMKGTKVTLWIDDHLIQEIDWKGNPDLPPAGEIQLGIGGGESHWDNFMIIGDEIQHNFAINPKSKLTITWGRLKNH